MRTTYFRAMVSSAVLVIVGMVASAVTAQDYDIVILNGRVMDPETKFDGVRNVVIKNCEIIAIIKDAVKGKDTINVGSKKQLFLGDRFLAYSKGVTLTVNNPMKTGELLIRADQPWESHLEAFNTVLKEHNGLLKMWYWVADYKRDASYLCYATSADGTHWEKPNLGLYKDFNGSTKNNIVLPGTAFAKKTRLAGGTVIRDIRAPAEKRYKFVWLPLGAYSPDGIHWTKYSNSLFKGISEGFRRFPVELSQMSQEREIAQSLPAIRLKQVRDQLSHACIVGGSFS